MFSCSEFFKACDTNAQNRIQPQQVPSQAAYKNPPLRQEQPPAFGAVPNRAVQCAYAEEKAIAAGPPVLEQEQNLTPEICQSMAPPPEIQNPEFGIAPEVEKPPPEPLELGPASPPQVYQLPVVEEQALERNDPPIIQPPPPQAVVPQPPKGPDLKEPEPEEAVEYNEAYEFKKALLSAGITLSICFGGMAFLLIHKDSFDAPECPEDDWYKANKVTAPKNCEPCGSGTIVIPLGGEWEKDWPKPMRAIMYFMGLGWCFLGIAIVCDQFMAAIEEVTSKERVVWVKVHGDTKHKFHKKVWNDTVANLTLMALGSSAPEILLSVIELVGNSFFAGELGPSTIVGSAAFNLLVITAVCVAAIPAPEVRKIDLVAVFAVTASLSVFAYAWLIVILSIFSPDVVTLSEALITFAFFPMLVIIAFLADKGYLGTCSGAPAADDSHITNEQQRLQKMYSKSISFETVKMMVEASKADEPARMTKAQHRRQLMKGWVGGGQNVGVAEITMGFAQPKYITLECAGTLDVPVKLSARVEGTVEVRYFTQDGLALAGKRYTHTEGSMSFKPNELEQIISIPIIDNEVWEEQEDFSVCLENLSKDGVLCVDNKLGYSNRTTQVVILNDDEPGTLCFFVDEVKASRDADSIQVGISRTNGSTGRITCNYETEDNTAVSGSNYKPVAGQLVFEDGVCKASIEIEIAPLGQSRNDRSFRVVLNTPSEGVKFDAERDGGPEKAICEVILPGTHQGGCAAYLVPSCNMKFSQSLPDWKDQVIGAIYCNGTAADQSTATKTDWAFHLLSIFWKVIFAMIPPAPIAGGWACFCIALAMIGGVTMIVGDMAALMGCCIGLPDDITAITIVALGTSLPDTFASKSAAQHDPNADNSIGNVTGSNCVNVFLGLGLPWTFGAIYWGQMGKTDDWKKKDFKDDNYEEKWGTVCPDGCFLVPAGSLTFSVTVFTITALTCIALLVARRAMYGGELGGPASASRRDAVILVLLWFVYIVASILKSLKVI